MSSTSSDSALRNYGNIAGHYLETNNKTWQSFQRDIVKEKDLNLPYAIQVNDFDYFSRPFSLAISQTQSTEAESTKSFLHPLIKVGNTILEDTSNGIKQWNEIKEQSPNPSFDELTFREFEEDPEGSKFRLICFSRSDLASKRANIVMRQAFGNELNLMETWKALVGYKRDSLETINYHLPTYRLMPWSTLGFLELKRLNVQIKTYIPQVLYYCESILRVSPERRVVFACLTTFKQCLFVACVRNIETNGKRKVFSYYSSEVITKNVSNEINLFAASSPDTLGFVSTFPWNNVTPSKVLGRGSTSCVLLCKLNIDQQKDIVLKISSNEIALLQEETIIDYLLNEAYFENKIPAYERRFPSQSGYRYFTKAFHPIGNISKDQYNYIWSIIAMIHRKGILHCDIRNPNIMLDDEGNIVIVDWSSARKFANVTIPYYREEFQQLATFYGASLEAIKSLMTLKNKAILFPADDAHLFLMLAIENLIICFSESAKEHYKGTCTDHMDAIINRRNVHTKISGYLSDNVGTQATELFDDIWSQLTFLNENRSTLTIDLDSIVNSTIDKVFHLNYLIRH